MSKSGNQFIHEADAASLDHAADLAELRAEYGRLATENGHLEARIAKLEGAIAKAAAILGAVGMNPLIDAHAYLSDQGRFPLSRAVRDVGKAIFAAREALDGAEERRP